MPCRFSPYSTFGDINDSNPNHTYGYLTEQLNKYGLAYVHFVEPRIAGNQDKEVTEEGHDLSIFRKKFQGTFIAAGGFLASEMLCWWPGQNNLDAAASCWSQDHSCPLSCRLLLVTGSCLSAKLHAAALQ